MPHTREHTHTNTHIRTHTQALHTFISSLRKQVSLGHLTIILSPTAELRAEITASCQRKCQEMFAWRERQVPAGEQGELCSPTLTHLTSHTHTPPHVSEQVSKSVKSASTEADSLDKNHTRLSQETELVWLWMTSPSCCSYMIQTYAWRWGFFFFFRLFSFLFFFCFAHLSF